MSDEHEPNYAGNGHSPDSERIVTPITVEDLDRSIRSLAHATAATGHFRPGGLLMPDFPTPTT